MMSFIARVLYFPTLLWNLTLNRFLPHWHWWDWIDEHVLLGALPFAADARRLHALGVRAVVNTCSEYAGPASQYAELGIEQFRIPTTDYTPPSLRDLEASVDFIERKIAEGKKVYVHCKAGRGRSATVAACYLIKNGRTPAEAQLELLSKRPQILAHVCKREVVLAYEKKVRAATSPA